MPTADKMNREEERLSELNEKLQLSGATLRTILQLSENLILIVDKNGIIIEASERIETSFGIPLDNIIGKASWSDFVAEEEIERIHGYFVDRSKGIGNPPSTYTLRIKIPGEEPRLMRANVGFIPGTENRIVILKDLSEVVFEQRKAAQTEERYRTVVENTQDGIIICAEDKILFANESFCRMTEHTREDIYSFSPTDLFHRTDKEKLDSIFFENEKGITRVFETSIKKRKGFLPVELSSTSMVYRNMETVLVSVRDLTQRLETEKQLRESHKLLKAIVDNSPVGVSVHDSNGTLLMANSSWRAIWNKSIEDLKEKMEPRSELRMDDKDTYLGDHLDDVEAVYRKGGELYIPNLRIRNPSPGGATNISHHFYALEDDDGKVDKVVILTLDLTESLKTRVELMETRNQFMELTGNIPVAVYRTSMEEGGRIIFSNPEMRRMFGGEEDYDLSKISVKDLYVDASRRKDLRDLLHDKNEVRGFEAKLKRLDGTTFIALISARMVSGAEGQDQFIEGIISDVTDRRRMEEELQRIEHLESIGTLAGGIAHDFNNLLMAIQGNISLARNENDPHEVSSRLEEAEASVEEATILTRQLLTFSRGGVPLKKPIDVATFIRETVLFSLRGSEIKAVFHFDDDLKMIEADREQIAQVIHNMAVNSQQAMTGSGTITVSCRNSTVKGDSDIHLKDGEYIRISILDTGKGIPPDDLQKIFNPYFTTKPDGSGLGLPTSYSIISRHSGVIEVFSEEEAGTEFVIYLPALTIEKKRKPSDPVIEPKAPSEPAHILIMDDDPRVREVLSGMLDVLGHEVTETSDGAEAIEQYRKQFESGEPYSAVIMDLTVPGGMGGETAIRKLKEIDPDVKAIVSSGYANNPVLSDYSEYGFSGRLTKPFRISTLKQELNSILCME